jgi:septum formation protein
MVNPTFPPFHKTLVLASKSPRRAQLLKDAGFRFRIHPIDVDETFSEAIPLEEVASFLAEKKAMAVDNSQLLDNEILLTADSVVVVNRKILNKPADADEAASMLRQLSDQSHKVYSGVCLQSREKKHLFTDETTVHFGPITQEEITFYIQEFKPFDKAGSYGIQDWIGLCKIKKIEGDYANVMGLPVHAVYQALLHF